MQILRLKNIEYSNQYRHIDFPSIQLSICHHLDEMYLIHAYSVEVAVDNILHG